MRIAISQEMRMEKHLNIEIDPDIHRAMVGAANPNGFRVGIFVEQVITAFIKQIGTRASR